MVSSTERVQHPSQTNCMLHCQLTLNGPCYQGHPWHRHELKSRQRRLTENNSRTFTDNTPWSRRCQLERVLTWLYIALYNWEGRSDVGMKWHLSPIAISPHPPIHQPVNAWKQASLQERGLTSSIRHIWGNLRSGGVLLFFVSESCWGRADGRLNLMSPLSTLEGSLHDWLTIAKFYHYLRG